uniref:Uncharacterized protein n=1 Tax=viral metagenome TaxID=1070528 RepID=A0A6M3IH90_9ZZZZ
MNYRTATLLAKKAYTADAVEVIPITVQQPISQIQILLKLQNQAFVAAGSYPHPVDAITKIELVEGSDVLFSLTGAEAQAVDFYHNKKEAKGDLRYLTDNWSDVVINLNFGRYLYDSLLALDPLKFENLQMIITLDISAGAVNPDNAYITVLAHIFDEKVITPAGFLMHTRVKSYNLVDAGHEYTPMPRDYAYRKLFVKSRRAQYYVSQQIDRIKLSEDQDRRVIINELTDEIMAMLVGQTPPYIETLLVPGTTAASYVGCTPAENVYAVIQNWRPATADMQFATYYGGGGQLLTIAKADGPNGIARVSGWCPHGVIEIPFGDQMDIEDWFDVKKVGSLLLDITGGESTGTCEILLQQNRSY